MFGAWPVLGERFEVRLRRVAFMFVETVLRPGLVQCQHLCIALDLGEDRGGADFGDAGIALDDGGCRHVDIRAAVAIDEDMLRRHGQLFHRLFHGQHGGLQDVDAVDLPGIDADHAPGDGAVAYLYGKRFTAFCTELFGIGQACNGLIPVQYDRGGDHVADQRATAGFIDTRQQTLYGGQFFLKIRNHSGRIAPVIIILAVS